MSVIQASHGPSAVTFKAVAFDAVYVAKAWKMPIQGRGLAGGVCAVDR